MKKKLMKYMLVLLAASLLLLTTLFVMLINHQYKKNIEKNLKQNNDLVINLITSNNINDMTTFFKQNFKSQETRVTYIGKDGNVLYDSEADSTTMDNHNSREEIIQARKIGSGYSIRYSHTIKKYMLYYATAFGDNQIIRSSMPLELVNSFEMSYIKYYLLIVLVILAASFWISSKLAQFIVKPIKDLEMATSEVAKGDLDKNVKVSSNDEVGELGKTFNDMTRRLKYTIKDALDKQNRLSAILQSMDSGVIAVDKNQKVIMVNPYTEEIFGIKKNIIGENFMDIIRDFELEQVFRNSSEDSKEIKIWWPKERDLRVKTADIINEDEVIGTVAVVQDITDIKILENMRSQFVANVSHELKTPLTSIKGFAETLKDVEDNRIKEKFLDIINDEAERLTRLIDDILTLSSIEQHKELKFEDVDLNGIIKDIFYLMKNTADGKNISLSISGERVPCLSGDKDQIKQMVLNLVDNAIKYSEKGDKVNVGTKVEGDSIILWVEDTGVGMSPEHLSRIFERFYRVDKARSRSQGGTGLGLAIVKHIVLSHEGTINVESEPGAGTRFTITLPLKREK